MMQSILPLICLLLLLCFSCQKDRKGQKDAAYLSTQADTIRVADRVRVADSLNITSKSDKAPTLSLTLMERRSAGTAISLKDITPNQQIHWIRFNKKDYQPENHRNILYRFYLGEGIPPHSTYEFEMVSMKGDKILFTSKESGYHSHEIIYVFDKPMYEITKQDIALKIFSSRKDTLLYTYRFSVLLDNKEIVGWVD